jgi:linoleate 10R-lipoxygenase
MTIPTENRNIMKNLGRESDYSYDRPSFTPPHVNLVSYPNVKLALEREKDFRVVWSGATALTSAKGGNDFWSKSLSNDDWRKNIKEFYEDITAKLLQEKSGNLAGIKQVDITRE